MAALCLVYFIAVGTLVGTAALLIEAALPARAPRRGVWAGSILLSLSLPPFLSAAHSSSAIDLLGVTIATIPATHQAGNSLTRNLMECGAPVGAFFLRLWLIATLLLLLLALANAVRILIVTRRSSLTEIDGFSVTLTDSMGPANVGVLRSRILMPAWVAALPRDERQYVLKHEAEHRKAHDSRLLAIMGILVCLWPWNPALWWQLHRLYLAIEIDCDNRVIGSLGDTTAYGETLLKVAEAGSRGPRLRPAFARGSSMLERRLRALVESRPHSRLGRMIAPVIAAALIYLVLSVPHPLPDAHQAQFHAARTHN